MANEGEAWTYTLDNAAEVTRHRFAALEALLNPYAFGRLAALGVRPGLHCLEVGTGSGSVARWLADRVGPAGRVLATDLDLRWASAGQHANLELRQHDITVDALPAAAFDVIFARLVLVHLPQREAVLDRLVTALKPDGALLLEEFDELLPAVPDTAAPHAVLANRVREAFLEFFRRVGASNAYPRTLPRLLTERGLVDVGMEGNWVCYRGGSAGASLDRANILQLREQLVGMGLLTASDIAEFLTALDDPTFIGSLPLLIAGHGRRAAA